jgi:hypothetical protein
MQCWRMTCKRFMEKCNIFRRGNERRGGKKKKEKGSDGDGRILLKESNGCF